MKREKTEILDELEHEKEMVVALRKHLRVLELQMAQFGIATPPHVLTEIDRLSEQIQRHETQAAQLETVAVEGELPLAEVEYRVLLAENWNTVQGRPTVVGATCLELARLRLGISPERAQQLEHDIRAALAREVISGLNDGFFTDYLQGYDHNFTDEFWKIGLAIRLNVEAAIEQFHLLLPPNLTEPKPPFEQTLLEINTFWLYQQGYSSRFEQFVTALPPVLRSSNE